MSIAKKVLKSQYMKEVASLAAEAPKRIDSILTEPAVEAAGAIGRLAKKGFTKTDQAFWNGYTGYQENALGVAAFSAGAGLYAAGSSAMKIKREDKIGEVSYTGTAPNLSYDGVGSRSQAPTLGASGSLVFGLNNMRRG